MLITCRDSTLTQVCTERMTQKGLSSTLICCIVKILMPMLMINLWLGWGGGSRGTHGFAERL